MIKEKQQAYSTLLVGIRKRVSEEELKEIRRLSLISLELNTPPHDFIQIHKFYTSDFVKEVICRKSLMLLQRELNGNSLIGNKDIVRRRSAVDQPTSQIYNWTLSIIGPEDTPFEGGVFILDIKFPTD